MIGLIMCKTVTTVKIMSQLGCTFIEQNGGVLENKFYSEYHNDHENFRSRIYTTKSGLKYFPGSQISFKLVLPI